MKFTIAFSHTSQKPAQHRSRLAVLGVSAPLALLVACGGGHDAAAPVDVQRTAAVATTDLLAKASQVNTAELAAAANQNDALHEAATGPMMLSKASARTPVYRFYNRATGAHFYTISPGERDLVRNTMPVFNYEGEAFFVSPVADAGLSPVYRFFNRQTGVHLYSISAGEKAYIEANLPQYVDEGVAYYASKTALAGMMPLYRFYVTTKGFHFYTTSASEKDQILANFPHYTFENVGYYVLNSVGASFTVGGTLSGLAAGQSLVLQNNAADDLTLSANGAFTFPLPVNQGGAYRVSLRTQPANQTCTVSNGQGTVTATGTQGGVQVSCVDSVDVSGTLSGLIGGDPVVLTLNGGGDLSLNANGSFTFGARAPLGFPYVVGVKTQPAGQSCAVGNATGTASASVNNVSVSCTRLALPDLVISEVGSCPYGDSSCWLEVYNPTTTARNLVNYRLRAGSSLATLFNLPNAVVAPGEYRILAGRVNAEAPVTALNTVVMVGGGASGVPDWFTTGLVELVSATSGATVDALRFGAAYAPQPLSAGQWSGPGVPTGFVGGGSDGPRSVVRHQATLGSQDTNTAQDWVAVSFATPGGPNDVAPGAVDADDDGLPDGNEVPGSTFNGLDLYSMGARIDQRDIFVEVDHMNSSKAGLIPQQAAMQKVVDAFASRGVALHIDVGSLFSADFDPAQFNLGQGDGTVPYQACVGFDVGDCATNTSATYRTVYDWKWQHFDPRRRGIFHYALLGDADSSGSAWGRGELFGNDFVLTMGGLTTVSPFLIDQQASTFMHELGHNLGLHHGGNDDVNFKPNYLSVMNYLMDSVSPGNSIWPYKKWKDRFGGGTEACYPGSTNPLCTATPVPFTVDYSDGSGLALNESALYESGNVGRGALPGVYADWDENFALTAAPVSRDLNGDGVLGVLTDHNDWGAITLPFARYYSGGLLHKAARSNGARKAAGVPQTGAVVPSPLMSDRGPTVITCGTLDPRIPLGVRYLNRLVPSESRTPPHGFR